MLLNYTRTLAGYTNILVYGSEIQPGCKIIANGTSTDAVITIDFGQDLCTVGKTVSLGEGIILIGNDDIVSFGTPYKDIVFVMSDCDDVITIFKTYSNALSVEVLGHGGDDKIVLGDSNRPLDTIIFANIIIDGGQGSRDVLTIHDEGSKESKAVAMHSMMLTGIHGSGSQTILYSGIESINLLLGSASTQVDISSTENDVSLTIITQGKHSLITQTGGIRLNRIKCSIVIITF